MQLFMLTVPRLDVRSDWRCLHDRLLDDFPEIEDVLATTIPATVLIVHEGDADVDGWLERVGKTIEMRRLAARRPARWPPAGRTSASGPKAEPAARAGNHPMREGREHEQAAIFVNRVGRRRRHRRRGWC